MSDICIFCDNPADSDEHLWAAWVHEFMKQNGIELGGLRTQIANEPEVIEYDLEKKIDTVCHKCNNTWMSQFEQKNRPRFLKMLQNEPFTLDPGGMKIIAEWAVLKSMVVESTKPRHGNEPFYTREERVAFHEHHQIPARARVWVGALDDFHIGAHTTDVTINVNGGKTRVGTGFVSTIYMGYFVCQVMTEHFFPNVPIDQFPPINPPPGISDAKLIQIYPQVTKKADWPPARFTNGGPDGIAHLMQRWRQGEKVSMVTKDGVVRLADPISPTGAEAESDKRVAAPIPEPVAPRPHKITILLGLMSPLFAMTAIVVSFLSFRTSQSSLTLSQKSLKIGQRAYIQAHLALGPARDVSDKFSMRSLTLQIKNTGNTPASMKAIKAGGAHHAGVVERDSLQLFVVTVLDPTISVGAKESEDVNVAMIAIPVKDIPKQFVPDGTTTPPGISVRAQVDYADVFGDTHHATIECGYYFDVYKEEITQSSCQNTTD